MSVRRLAEDSVQPAGFSFSEENAVWAEATIRKYPEGRQQSAVIPLLMRAQEQDGWVTRAAIEFVADKLDMPYIRVLEVATFYTQFQLKPVGTRAHVQICGTTPCMLRGSEDLMAVCRKKIAPEPFTLNAEGTLSWEEVECLGACVNAPMVMIFKDTYEDLTPLQLEHIIDRFDAGHGDEIKPGPQIDRISSAPVGGPVTLTSTDRPVAAAAGATAAETTAAPVITEPANAGRADPAADETNPAIKSPADGKSAQPAGNPNAEPAKPDNVALEQTSLNESDRPKGIERPAAVDDLKMISGVGPKIEAQLHELGIFTFAQIVGWTPAERQWVDGYLKFKGRIDRDDWVKQADALARGGEEEYMRVFGKKPR